MFDRMSAPAPDPLYGVAAAFAADTRAAKMDLGVGVFRDEHGLSPIIGAVAEAERAIANAQTTKSYLPQRGEAQFLAGMSDLIFGPNADPRIASVQCVGGTGGVYLALAVAAAANPGLRVLVGTPTWPNHIGICEQLGLEVETFAYFDAANQRLLPDNLYAALRNARAGDVLILHGPCHNPTGADLSAEQLGEALTIAQRQGVTPLIDAAYYGLGDGLEPDIAMLRRIVAEFPNALLTVSCSKMFSLYRERAGALFIAAANASAATIASANAQNIARRVYSGPPAHGAAVVGRVLNDAKLRAAWADEVSGMRSRLLGVRERLARYGNGLPALAHVTRQCGIFSMLPISAEVVATMARDHAIYMPHSGRINIAGFKAGDEEMFAAALGVARRQ